MKILVIDDTSAVNLDYLTIIEKQEELFRIIIYFSNGHNRIINCVSKEKTIELYERIIKILKGLSKV